MPKHGSSSNRPVEPERIVEQLLDDLQRAAQEVTPAFIRTMPNAYFHDTTPQMRLAHIKAIIAAEASGTAQTVTLRDAHDQHFTFISNRNYPGQLGEFVKRLPHDRPLTSAKVYTSERGDRVLDIFHFGEHVTHDPAEPAQAAKAEILRQFVAQQPARPDTAALERHLLSCDGEYLVNTAVEQIYRHLLLVERVRQTGNLQLQPERYHEPEFDRLTIGFAQDDPRLLFERTSHYLGRQALDIHRAYLDRFRGTGDDITLLTFIVTHQGDRLTPDSASWHGLAFDLRRLAHLDEAVFELAQKTTANDLLGAELLLALAHLAHQRLVQRDPLLYSRDRIYATLERYPALAIAVVDCFRRRFATDKALEDKDCAGLRASLVRESESEDARILFDTLTDAVLSTLRTNWHLPERRSLALRIDPSFLTDEGREKRPFGVFFVSGHQFDGFHVRFRDIARGGVRIVQPHGQEQYALETERHYNEAYGLAYAQQQKNKDIPEGGSKAVVLAAPSACLERVGRAFTDGLLDLIIPDPWLHALHRDHYGDEELLYLGPDENISNTLIGWIVERARQRGHPMPDAFMSSKPTAGINHKEYGVTSEGVTVFLEHALRAVGIDPRHQPFTVKMTGGPDGDVAGNEILILHREFKRNARILGIADGSGVAEDPAGLDLYELTRLVKAALPIARFDPARLGPNGRVVSIHQPEGVNLRNTLHNRILADAFIPAGGRPNTLNATNWTAFLDAAGKPSARVIVEGANLFLSPEVRTRLSEKGVIIIKDSSANKCGVICSSYEIIASMLLDQQAFVDLKSTFVEEVLGRLRALAALEARTLFRESLHKPSVPLPELSTRLSRAITRASDAVAASIAGLAKAHEALVRQLVVDHLPPSLYQRCGEQVFERIPENYLNRVIASSLASRIVYREGIDWFESMPPATIARLAERYLVEEAQVKELVREVRKSQLNHRERIAALLEAGGVTAALRTSED